MALPDDFQPTTDVPTDLATGRDQNALVPESMLRTLSDEADREGAWLKVLEDENTRHEVARLVAEGDAIQWANPSWRRELAAWMHPSRTGDELTVPWVVVPVAD